ncbi:hypothetical protein [Ornithinimicrobium sp. INDO-MA30-4]|uniref:hypothetical protein n=1 Tax=Ornithinimicrobium sp. INDO-MA30-4 TaxID=2908651 RepID=UPI001F414E4F|nr:hypothetical protein [Ornithinimicrobium sp. INDO-MA30-4]UJH70422.1 hypothetical protein L0A91_15105 [Ornithinimicrobium sp. INDO-MA30-4]
MSAHWTIAVAMPGPALLRTWLRRGLRCLSCRCLLPRGWHGVALHHGLNADVQGERIHQRLPCHFGVVATPEGVSHALGGDFKQNALTVKVDHLGIDRDEAPGHTANLLDGVEHLIPLAPNSTRIEVPRLVFAA